MPDKETSEEVSKLASKYINFTAVEFYIKFGEAITHGYIDLDNYVNLLTEEIRTLAASCLSQDETKGAE